MVNLGFLWEVIETVVEIWGRSLLSLLSLLSARGIMIADLMLLGVASDFLLSVISMLRLRDGYLASIVYSWGRLKFLFVRRIWGWRESGVMVLLSR
jgi:hypothetical protein